MLVAVTSSSRQRDLKVGDELPVIPGWQLIVDRVLECNVDGMIKYELVLCHLEVNQLRTREED